MFVSLPYPGCRCDFGARVWVRGEPLTLISKMELAGNLEETRGAFAVSKEEETRLEAGEDVTLTFSFSGRDAYTASFKVGATVAYCKLMVSQHYSLIGTTVLLVHGKALMDPLSLSDCPGIGGGQTVAVEVTCS